VCLFLGLNSHSPVFFGSMANFLASFDSMGQNLSAIAQKSQF